MPTSPNTKFHKKIPKTGWSHPDKARIETGHKAFDKFCNYLGTGNVIGNGQFSNYIRPENETECNDRIFAAGELRDFDLKPFKNGYKLPDYLEKVVKAHTRTECAILYVLSHYVGKNQTIHGFLLTKGADQNHKLIMQQTTGPTHKSQDVLNWCRSFLST